MVEEEFHANKNKLPDLEQELKILLLPKEMCIRDRHICLLSLCWLSLCHK